MNIYKIAGELMCPVCNKKGARINYRTSGMVQLVCNKCGYRTKLYEHFKYAVNEWNDVKDKEQ